MSLSRRQMEARADSVRNAVAITRMEGGEPSAFCREQLDRSSPARSLRKRCASMCCDTTGRTKMPEITRRQILAGAAATAACAAVPVAAIADMEPLLLWPKPPLFDTDGSVSYGPKVPWTLRGDRWVPCTVADVVKNVAAGRIDHQGTIEFLELETYEQLVECLRLRSPSMAEAAEPTVDLDAAQKLERPTGFRCRERLGDQSVQRSKKSCASSRRINDGMSRRVVPQSGQPAQHMRREIWRSEVSPQALALACPLRASLLASAIASTLWCSRFFAASIQDLSP
jgi:hypothetical protein